MKKTLNQMLKGYRPKPGDEQEFVDKHVISKAKHLGGKATEDDKLFQATNIKTVKREEEHGYDADKSDEQVYESTVNEGKVDDMMDRLAAKKERDADDLSKDAKTSVKKTVKKVAGKAYGGSKQKDDQKDIDEETYAQQQASLASTRSKREMTGAIASRIRSGGPFGSSTPDTKASGSVGDVSGSFEQPEKKDKPAPMSADDKKVVKKTRTPITINQEEVEQVEEKKLTPAEMKKREEVARAIERENPNMPMAKKMAIATATAKKVAEQKTFAQFMNEAMSVSLHVKPHPQNKGQHVVVKSSDKSRFKHGETVSSSELEQGQDDGYLKVKHVKE